MPATSPTNSVEIATDFTKAWTTGDFETVRSLVADDVVFQGPMATVQGADDYIASLEKLQENVRGARIIAAFGDDDSALLMYDLITKTAGPITCAKLLTIKQGRIIADKLTFDPRKLLDAPKPKADGKAKPQDDFMRDYAP
jgi:hypothetical protein